MPNLQELQSENAKLKQQLKEQDDFIATAIHDLRNPLTLALIATDLLKDKGLDTKTQELLQGSLSRLNKLIERNLAVPKLERGHLKPDFKELNLKTFLERFCNTQLPLLKKKKIKFRLDNTIPDTSIAADASQLQQVFENLVSNAIRFTPKDGTGVINLKSEITNSHKIRISVLDNGPCIPDDQKTKIFAKFMSQSKEQSTGLGLYICRKIIKLHDGKIWCEDGAEGGAEFVVEIN